jgi:hypothetical protein
MACARLAAPSFIYKEAEGGSNLTTVAGTSCGAVVYVAGGTVTMNADIVDATSDLVTPDLNTAQGGQGMLGEYGNGFGGGLYVAGGSMTHHERAMAVSQMTDARMVQDARARWSSLLAVAKGRRRAWMCERNTPRTARARARRNRIVEKFCEKTMKRLS